MKILSGIISKVLIGVVGGFIYLAILGVPMIFLNNINQSYGLIWLFAFLSITVFVIIYASKKDLKFSIIPQMKEVQIPKLNLGEWVDVFKEIYPSIRCCGWLPGRYWNLGIRFLFLGSLTGTSFRMAPSTNWWLYCRFFMAVSNLNVPQYRYFDTGFNK